MTKEELCNLEILILTEHSHSLLDLINQAESDLNKLLKHGGRVNSPVYQRVVAQAERFRAMRTEIFNVITEIRKELL